jgi:gluconolactonase
MLSPNPSKIWTAIALLAVDLGCANNAPEGNGSVPSSSTTTLNASATSSSAGIPTLTTPAATPPGPTTTAPSVNPTLSQSAPPTATDSGAAGAPNGTGSSQMPNGAGGAGGAATALNTNPSAPTGDAGASMASAGGAGGVNGAGGLGGAAGAGLGGAVGVDGGDDGARLACPAGPFPTPMVISSADVCEDFSFAHTWNEGPTWVASQNAFFFSNFVALSASGGEIIKYTPGAGCEVFMTDIGCNGLAVSNDGNLLAACQETRSILRIDLETKETSTVADNYMGTMLDTPNDLVQHSNGSIYFTNPTNELAGRPVGVGPGSFRVDPNGEVNLIAEGNCNGIGLSPDETKLYVILQQMWDLDEQGEPSNSQSMFTGGDGMGVDCAGNVYASGSIFNPEGENIGSWGSGTNLAFGGPDGTLVLVAGPNTQLRELTVNVPGLP